MIVSVLAILSTILCVNKLLAAANDYQFLDHNSLLNYSTIPGPHTSILIAPKQIEISLKMCLLL